MRRSDTSRYAESLAASIEGAVGKDIAEALVTAHWPEVCLAIASRTRKIALVGQWGEPLFLAPYDLHADDDHMVVTLPEPPASEVDEAIARMAGPDFRPHDGPTSAPIALPMSSARSYRDEGPFWSRLAIVTDAIRRRRQTRRVHHYLRYIQMPSRADRWKALGGAPLFEGEDARRTTATRVDLLVSAVAKEAFGTVPLDFPNAMLALDPKELEGACERLSTLARRMAVPADLEKAYERLERPHEPADA